MRRHRPLQLAPVVRALATDYDGTLARNGHLNARTLQALDRWKNADRRLILVTGRRMVELGKVCPRLDLFDRVVAENGALLFEPAHRHTKCLAPPAPARFVPRLRARGVRPLAVGEVIVATTQQFRPAVEAEISALGLEWRIIMNKGAAMALPSHVDKATGLLAALADLRLSATEVAGIGDAENDEAFLSICGYSAAVANAKVLIKKQVHFVAEAGHGAGVAELIDRLLEVVPEIAPSPAPARGFAPDRQRMTARVPLLCPTPGARIR